MQEAIRSSGAAETSEIQVRSLARCCDVCAAAVVHAGRDKSWIRKRKLLEPFEFLPSLAGDFTAPSRIYCVLSLDKQTRCLENVLVVALHAPGLSVPLLVLQNLAARHGFGQPSVSLTQVLVHQESPPCRSLAKDLAKPIREARMWKRAKSWKNSIIDTRQLGQRCRYGVARCGRQGLGTSGRRVHGRFEIVVRHCRVL